MQLMILKTFRQNFNPNKNRAGSFFKGLIIARKFQNLKLLHKLLRAQILSSFLSFFTQTSLASAANFSLNLTLSLLTERRRG